MSRKFLMGASVTTVALTTMAAAPSLGANPTQNLLDVPAIEAASVPAPAKTPISGDPLGQQVDYKAAAGRELLSTPTRNFKLSARFGEPGANWSSGYHTGLDFVGAIGTPIFAAAGGTVVSAKPEGAYGNMVKIRHADGTRTLYAHMNSFSVEKGQKVSRGERIGSLGSTGNSTGPHLHFEVIRDGKQQDPERFLGL